MFCEYLKFPDRTNTLLGIVFFSPAFRSEKRSRSSSSPLREFGPWSESARPAVLVPLLFHEDRLLLLMERANPLAVILALVNSLTRLLNPLEYVGRELANGPKARESSPVPGISTLITLSPNCARILVQKGPARTWDTSRTLMPLRGGDRVSCMIGFPYHVYGRFGRAGMCRCNSRFCLHNLSVRSGSPTSGPAVPQ